MAKGEFFKNVPPWAKGVLVVAGVAGVGIISYNVWKAIKNAKGLEDAKKENKEAGSVADKLKKAGIKPTMDSLQLSNAVNGIKSAWLLYGQADAGSIINPAGALVNTRKHVQPFYRELAKVGNDLDMANLISDYGVQTIDFPWYNIASNDFTGNLTQSVKNFLNESEIKAANDMLARKGIKYRF